MLESQNPYAAPQADLAPPPGTQWLQGVSPSLTKTGWGLSLVYFGIVSVLACALFMGFSLALGEGGVGTAIRSLALLGILLGYFAVFIGPFFCLSVPAESGGKGFVIGSVLLQFPGLLNLIAYQLLPKAAPGSVNALVQILGVISFLLFVLFLRKLARYIGRIDLTRRARNILIGFAVILGLGIAFVAGLYTRIITVDMVYTFPLGIGALIVFVMYANLVNELRKALAAGH